MSLCRSCSWSTKWVFLGTVDWKRRFETLTTSISGNYFISLLPTWLGKTENVMRKTQWPGTFLLRNQWYCTVCNSRWLSLCGKNWVPIGHVRREEWVCRRISKGNSCEHKVLTAVTIKNRPSIFRDETPRVLVEVCHNFGETYCFHFHRPWRWEEQFPPKRR